MRTMPFTKSVLSLVFLVNTGNNFSPWLISFSRCLSIVDLSTICPQGKTMGIRINSQVSASRKSLGGLTPHLLEKAISGQGFSTLSFSLVFSSPLKNFGAGSVATNLEDNFDIKDTHNALSAAQDRPKIFRLFKVIMLAPFVLTIRNLSLESRARKLISSTFYQQS